MKKIGISSKIWKIIDNLLRSHLPPQHLLLGVFFLGVQPPFFGTYRRLGRNAFFFDNGDAFYELRQTLASLLFVLLLAAMLLGLDDDDALFCDALVFKLQQTLLVELRQR